MIGNSMSRQSVDQLSSRFHTELLENMVGVDLYGSLTQKELLRYSFARETTSNQSRDLLFALSQGAGGIGAFASWLPRKLRFDMTKPSRPQSKQAVREHLTLFRRVRRRLLWSFHVEPNVNQTPGNSIRTTKNAKRLSAVT
jgi:hypothetical protein